MAETVIDPVGGMPASGSRAHELLLRVIAYIRSEGRVDLSLRQLAQGAGTSHRMLGYYFGTREQLLGYVMQQLSRDYLANFKGKHPETRAEAIAWTWQRFRDPNNRLQTQLLFTLSNAAAENPDVEIPGLTSDLDAFALGLTALGVREGLDTDRATREARLIVATLLGLYLDFFITRGSVRIDDSYTALVEWVERSSASA